MSYAQWRRFWTTLYIEFDRYSLDQVIDKRITALSTTIFFHVRWTMVQLRKKHPWPMTYALWPCNEIGFVRLSQNMFIFHGQFHHAKCSGSWVIVSRSFLSYISDWWKIRKSGPVTLIFDLWCLKSIEFVRWSRYVVVQNFTKLRAQQRFVSYRIHRQKKTPRGQ